MAPGPSLKQKLQQKLLKPKYTPHTDDEAVHLVTPAARSGSADILLDAVSSKASSRPGSTDPAASPEPQAYHDITASLLAGDTAAATGGSDQGATAAAVKKAPGARGAFKGCLPFGKPPLAPKPNDGLPTAFNNRQSILSRLSKAAKKTVGVTDQAAPKAKPAPKPAAVKTKKVAHPLHMAAWRTNISELQEQLGKPGADANKRDKNSMTPLHYAAWQGSIDCVQLLLEHKADINKADAEGMLPIHFAAMFNRLDVAAMLLDRGSHLQPPPAKKGRLQVSWPTTPLVVAARMGHTGMVALLMDRGADVKGVTKASKSALHEAALAGHAEVVAEMLRKGVDHDLALPKTGHRALHLASLKGSQPVVQALLLGGADVNARAKDSRTPLHLACEAGNMEAAAALIGLGGADLALRDAGGFTPLHVAVDRNHLALAKTLMDSGAAVDTATNLGALPLNFAHDPDFYKLLRAVRWYSAASCPSGNNPSSSSYWSPPGAMEAAAAAGVAAAGIDIELPAEQPAPATATAAEGGAAGSIEGMPLHYFGPDVAAPDARYFGDYGSSPAAAASAAAADAHGEIEAEHAAAAPHFQAPSPTQGLVLEGSAAHSAPAAAAASAAAAAGGNGVSGKGPLVGQKAKKPGVFPASSWLKNLHLPGKAGKKKAAAAAAAAASSLAATAALASGGFAPLSAAAGSAPSPSAAAPGGEERPQLPASCSAPEQGASYAAAGASFGAEGSADLALVGNPAHLAHPGSRSNSRASSISLAAAGARSARHSPSPSDSSSVVARTTAAEMTRAAVAAVVERAAREEEAEQAWSGAASAGGPAAVAAAGAPSGGSGGVVGAPRSAASSPETWSCSSMPNSAVTASAASGVATQAALRRLLGFEDHPPLGKVAPGDVGTRRSVGDQDKWLPGTAATPASAATFAAFAADASEQDDVRAAAALAATAHAADGDKDDYSATPGAGRDAAYLQDEQHGCGGHASTGGDVTGPKASAAAAAAAFTAAAAAAAAAAVGGGVGGAADAVKQGSPSSTGSASKGSAGKKASRTSKVLRPWRT